MVMHWALFSGLLLVGSLAVVVAVAANRRGQSFFACLSNSVLVSPIRAAPRLQSSEDSTPHLIPLTSEPLLPPVAQFESEGFYGDVPYKVNESGSVDAILMGRVVRFPDADRFLRVAQFMLGGFQPNAVSR
jgi:hypothetical protein